MENRMSCKCTNSTSSLNKTMKIIYNFQFLVILTFLSAWSAYDCLAAEQHQQRGLRSILKHEPPIQLTTYESSATQLKAPTQMPRIQFVSKNDQATMTSKPKSTTNNEQNSATLASRPTLAPTTTTIKHKGTPTTPAGIENTWIESILINVESLNLNHDTNQESSKDIDSLSHNDEDDLNSNTSEPIANSSQAPTDSGEDPLETTTLSSSVLDQQQQQINATQYSIESSLLGGSTDSNLSNNNTENINNNNNNNNRSTSYTPDIESNNVSAVAIDNQIIINDRNSSFPSESSTTQAPEQSISCEQAYTQCALRKVCAPALKAYNDDCQDLINNRTNQCSPKCLKAMIALRSSEEGDDLVNCDCHLNEYCTQSKQRSQACKPQVELAVDPKTVVSCSTASWICMADQLCSTALEYYYRNCQTLFSQRHCSMRCNNSLSILYRQPKASKLINCHCDGSEEFPCIKYKTYTERLCLNKPSQPSDFMEDDRLVEEDTLNLTNDPEAFTLGSLASSSFINNRDSDNNFDDGADDDDDSVKKTIVANSQRASASTTGGAEESSSTSYNGIQLVEDNYIHLMSGRYFTNLYGQQQKTKRQQRPSQQQDLPQQLMRKAKPLKGKGNLDWTSNRRRTSSSSASAYRPWESWLKPFLVTMWPVFVYLIPSIVSNRLLLH